MPPPRDDIKTQWISGDGAAPKQDLHTSWFWSNLRWVGIVSLFFGLQWLENDLLGLNLKRLGLVASLLFFTDYFIKPSPLLQDGSTTIRMEDKERPVWDKLVWSSAVYAVAGVYSVAIGQYAIGAMQFLTSIGSSLYHLRKEAMYFNFDNVFATTMLVVTLWAIRLAVAVRDTTFLSIIAAGLPFAAFLMIYCGMPACVVVCKSSGSKSRQCAGGRYDTWHTLWHFVSGFGTALCATFFAQHWPELQCGGGQMGLVPLPIVPTVCLMVGWGINYLGNAAGVMPVL